MKIASPSSTLSPHSSASTTIPSLSMRLCDTCKTTIPSNSWSYHLRSNDHKQKARQTDPANSDFKILKSSFTGRIKSLIYTNQHANVLNPSEFFKLSEESIISVLNEQLCIYTSLKFNLELFAEYIKIVEECEEISIKSFQSSMTILLQENDIPGIYHIMREQIIAQMDEFQERNSGWYSIVVNKYKSFRNQFKSL